MVLLLSSSALAGNYHLEDLDRFDEPVLEKFRQLGIETTEQFLARSLSRTDRIVLGAKVGIGSFEIDEFAQDCELMQVAAVGPKAARLLRVSGIKGVHDLASREPRQLLKTLKQVNPDKKFTPIDPDLRTVQHWVLEAPKARFRLE